MPLFTSPIVTRRGPIAALVAAAALWVPQSLLPAQRVLTVIARDTMLEANPTVAAGLTTIRLSLEGKARRDLVVHRVPAGTAPETLARGAVGRPTRWFDQWSFGGPSVPRDSITEVGATFELRPGRYVLVSYEVDSLGRARGDRMMWRQLTAVPMSVLIPARFAKPDVTFRIKDTRIDVVGTVRPGQRTVQVENAGGRPHELLIGRLKPGKTLADVRKWDRSRAEPPPFVYVGGLTPMSPTKEAQTRLVFQSGTHVVLCPMREDREREHDYQRGVLATFDVK